MTGSNTTPPLTPITPAATEDVQIEQAKAEIVKREYAAALALLEPWANRGSRKAQLGMGIILSRAAWEGIDYEKARYWFEKAFREWDSAQACYLLGCMSLLGAGRPIDYGKAFYYFNELKDGENRFALCNLGMLYCFGLGIEKNQALAQQYFRRSAQLGYIAAGMYWGVLELYNGHRMRGMYLMARYSTERLCLTLFRPNDKKLHDDAALKPAGILSFFASIGSSSNCAVDVRLSDTLADW